LNIIEAEGVFMPKIVFMFIMICLSMLSVYGSDSLSTQPNIEKDKVPKYLYKVISVENWKKSQGRDSVQLTEDDKDFIHLAREDQLDRIIEKYWNHVPEFMVLKIDTAKLPGKLIFEANPGGANKYYHLYEGSIPLKAVVESRRKNRVEQNEQD
jgi:uncharacterized protein (DUF952 family)